MSDKEKIIYEQGAEQYDRLIGYEDSQGNLLPAIQKVITLENCRAVDLGAGTGRLTRLLAPHGVGMIGLDISASMLKVAYRELSRCASSNWLLCLGDHRCLPLAARSVDVIVSGWSLSYLAVWQPDTWRAELEQALDEMQRVLRPHGSILLLETLGTGRVTPKPPATLEAYYEWLAESGFNHTWLRTDYHFPNRQEAFDLTRFFFGEEMCTSLVDDPFGVTLPECTGVWWINR